MIERRDKTEMGVIGLVRLVGRVGLLWFCVVRGVCSGAETSVAVGSGPGYPGRTTEIPVLLRNGTNVIAGQVDMAFNVSRVSVGSPVATARVGNHVVKSREIAPGVRRTLIYSASNAVIAGTNGAIVQMPFTISPRETVGSGPIIPSNVILAQADSTGVSPVALTAGTIFVRPVNLLPNGHVQFFLNATEGQHYLIQATTNLVDWVTISTNSATSSFMDLVDIDAANYPYRFYRSELRQP